MHLDIHLDITLYDIIIGFGCVLILLRFNNFMTT